MRTRLERPIRRKLDYELRLFTSDEERDDDDDDSDGTSKIAKYTEFFFRGRKGRGACVRYWAEPGYCTSHGVGAQSSGIVQVFPYFVLRKGIN